MRIGRLNTLLIVLIFAAMPCWAQGIIQAPPFTPTSGGGSSPAFVQGAENYQNTAAQTVVTMSAAVTAGDGLFVYCQGLAACTTPTSTGATETFATYTGTSGCQDFGGDDVQCWAVTNAAGGDTAINCNAGSTGAILCIVGEYTRPQHLVTPKDAGGHGFNSASTGFSVSTSAATTNANDIVWACFGGFGANFTPGITITGFTMPASMQQTYGGCGYQIASSATTQTAAGSWTSSGSQRATGVVMAFKP